MIGLRTWICLVIAVWAAFLGSWSLLHHGLLGRGRASDVPVYIQYGRAVVHGKVPYRDFHLEYPPAALPVLVVPAILDVRRPGYDHWFDREMAFCGCLLILAVALCLRRLGASRRRCLFALTFVAISPLLIGSVILGRFDLWPTMLAAFALAALLWERRTTAAALLGLAIAAKLWPAILVPIALAWLVRTAGAYAAARFAAVTAAVVAAIFVPFATLGATGLRFSFHRQFGRPLQVESFGSSLLIVLHHVTDLRVVPVSGWGSQNVAGPAAYPVEVATTTAQIVMLLFVWVLFARGPATHARLLTAMTASVASFLAFGKVFSPQFVIWLVPFVALLHGYRRLTAAALAATAFVLTQVEYPHHYKQFSQFFYIRPTVDVLLRNLSLLALAALLAWSLTAHGRHPASPGGNSLRPFKWRSETP